ncbi:hypothetical protein L873DRAFT_1770525 [Choiromyces venosus 120613-1]|uniref:Fungal N-terminal domain-containing protein n=1 Tax=Choiromyces venosus 120613-1 TaxID=1336337 RepID=A0A3N4JHJ3_9PEZI|nr:hypothetical protein L873DRAFT_1770525 [Choiromyces venosus 120613-1]
MSFGFSLGDFIGGAKLVWDLYHNCFLVAKDAPNEFLDLMRELSSLRGVLKCIEDEINTRRIDESRKVAIKRAMGGTTHTLRRLEALVLKYRKLGFSDGLHFWKRIGWAKEQRDIEGFRIRIMAYACTLNLCISSVGESTISTIERDFKQAFYVQDQLQLNDIYGSDTGSAIVPNFLETSRRESEASRFTDETCISQLEGYESPVTSPTTSESPDRPRSIRPTSPLGSVNSIATDLIDFSIDGDQDSSAASVLDVLARASDLLSNCPERESILQQPVMLDWDPPNPENLVSDSMHKRFSTNAKKGKGDPKITTEFLLRAGTWWVLKSRNAVRLETNSIPNASSTSSSDPNSGLYQAYFDLMKASWILYNYLLSDPDNTLNMPPEDIKSFSTLQNAIDEDFDYFRQKGLAVNDIEDMKLNDKIWEFQQPFERSSDEQEKNPLLDPGRWITIEDHHAGSDGEVCHLRFFVNAELGNKRIRMKTKDAQYMLILWTTKGQSELMITLCNQSGRLKISRDIMPDDIRSFPGVDKTSNLPPAVDIEFKEIDLETTIYFLHINDFRSFVEIPTRFFGAVQERNPTSGNETMIYRSVLQSLELLHPNTNKPINPGEAFHSVDLRVYETTGEEGWMTTRRLVLSSSASAAQPWCTSYFLPLSKVQIKGCGTKRLTVKWSDCGQRFADSRGQYNKFISYVYDEERPNKCLVLVLGSVEDANKFEDVVLKLSLEEKYRWDSPQESRYIYSIRSTIDNVERFKGLLIRHRSPEWKYSGVFYLPRDLDFELKNNGFKLRLLKAYYTNYISNHVERLYELEPGKQPKFSHCEKKVESVNLSFGSEEDARNLLRHITSKWELKFVRQITRVSHKPTNQKSLFRAVGLSSCGPADLSLWQKGEEQRLVIRRSSFSSTSAELYLTAMLHKERHDSEKIVVQKNVEVTRGGLVDIVTMEAVCGRRGSSAGGDGGSGLVKEGQTLSIEFATVKDNESLAEVSRPI